MALAETYASSLASQKDPLCSHLIQNTVPGAGLGATFEPLGTKLESGPLCHQPKRPAIPTERAMAFSGIHPRNHGTLKSWNGWAVTAPVSCQPQEVPNSRAIIGPCPLCFLLSGHSEGEQSMGLPGACDHLAAMSTSLNYLDSKIPCPDCLKSAWVSFPGIPFWV